MGKDVPASGHVLGAGKRRVPQGTECRSCHQEMARQVTLLPWMTHGCLWAGDTQVPAGLCVVPPGMLSAAG